MDTPLTPASEPEFFAREARKRAARLGASKGNSTPGGADVEVASSGDRFPDCTIYRCEQRSEEWFDLRKGVLTASEMAPWLVKTDKRSIGAKEKLLCRKLAEIAGCEMAPIFETWAMTRGTDLEPDAVEEFERRTGLAVEAVGFCLHEDGAAGCSPDGLIVGESIGFEGKAPVPETHVRYLREGILPTQYVEQVHGSMAVTGASGWWFQSFCPGLPSLRLLIERDDYTEKVAAGLRQFAEELAEMREWIAGLWDETFAGA